MKNLFVVKLANTLSEACGRCMIKTSCDDADKLDEKGEDADEKLRRTFGLKMPCGGLEYIVYTPIVQLKERRF